MDRPAMVVELKFGGCADGAIAQIMNNNYPQVVQEFVGEILLVGVNYDRRSKRHECGIERWEKIQGVNSRSKAENSRSKVQEQIVKFCSEPRSLEEIALHINSKDKYYMKRIFINPILGLRLRMTEPESPTSPTQKYVRIEVVC